MVVEFTKARGLALCVAGRAYCGRFLEGELDLASRCRLQGFADEVGLRSLMSMLEASCIAINAGQTGRGISWTCRASALHRKPAANTCAGLVASPAGTPGTAATAAASGATQKASSTFALQPCSSSMRWSHAIRGGPVVCSCSVTAQASNRHNNQERAQRGSSTGKPISTSVAAHCHAGCCLHWNSRC